MSYMGSFQASGVLTSITLNGNTGSATTIAGVANILGSGGITTSATGNTVTISGSGIPTGIVTINGDTGSVTGSTISLHGKTLSGSSVVFAGSAATMNLAVTDTDLNTTIGATAGNGTLSGSENTSVGANTLHALTSGNYNTALGSSSLQGATSGSQNTAIGRDALAATTTGTGNTALGYGAGVTITTGSNNIYLGEIDAAVNSEANTTRIGNTGSTAACYILGIDGVSVGSVATVVTESGNKLGTSTIVAGPNVSVIAGATTITIGATGMASFAWSVITADQTAAVNTGYICNKAGALSLALPATAAVGSSIRVTGINTALGWSVTQSSGQQIFYGASSTTSGASGSLSSSATRDSIEMVCIIANTTWQVLSSVGNITVV